ncbi:MAG TPA: DUF1549 domain-containing protein [Bryobacteraceae bacterium]|nr:DUF1549 domain-containing protein [Bryobacteraceae bacterium]
MLPLLLLLGSVAAFGQVDFASQVHPILAARCAACHTGESAQAGLRVDDRAGFVRVRAKLIGKVRGTEGMRMPPSGAPLTEAEIAILERWVAADLPWTDTKAKGAAKWIAPLEPRAVTLRGEGNPIDVLTGGPFRPAVSDAVFARRVYFDLWGIAPTPEQLAAARGMDRGKLVDQLLADRSMFAGHWMSFWNDMLRNDLRAYHGESTKPYTPWLLDALRQNMPYDEMVRQLVNPVGPGAPAGFLVGVNWRGDVNASQLPHMQAAQNTAQVFLGVNLKCASCHDSFVNKYKLRESYGMAAIYAETPQLELVRCDVKTGMKQGPQFLFPALGSIPQDGTLAERRAAAAALFTSPKNGRLARTFVNRIWGRLFGRAIVEPVDDMDAEPFNADLLDWLANDFATHGYDINRLLRLVMTSKTWQQPALPQTDMKFRGPLPRRLTAEQFVDTLSSLTGEWRVQQNEKGARMAREWEFKSTALSRAMGRPIRDQVYTTRPAEASTLQALELVNGTTLALALRRGAQRLTGTLPEAPAAVFDSKTVKRGATPLTVDVTGLKEAWLLVEDAGSYDPERTVAGWAGLAFDGVATRPLQGTQPRTVEVEKSAYADTVVAPFGKAVLLTVPEGARRLTGQLVVDDVGRLSDVNSAVRFYIFPRPPDRNLLTKVTEPLPAPAPGIEKNRARMTERLFLQMLGRGPTAAEKKLAEGVELEDLLWTLLLHPEFQYVD